MSLKCTDKYDDIMHLSRPASTHPKMDVADRAKIFSPFAALKGHGDAVREKERVRVNRSELSDEEQEKLNLQLNSLKKGMFVTVTYFHKDPGSDGSGGEAEGEYLTITGTIQKLDPAFQLLQIDGQEVPFKDISHCSISI